MRILPVIISTPRVRSILDDRMTMMRELVKKKYSNTDLVMRTDKYGIRLIERQNDAPPDETIIDDQGRKVTRRHLVACREVDARYRRGDILWVRETWRPYEKAVGQGATYHIGKFVAYKADENDCAVQKSSEWYEGTWRPSIHMPKAAARLFLRVTDVRIERLQEITEEDAKAEGAEPMPGYCDGAPAPQYGMSYRLGFSHLWDSINAKRGHGWDANDWVEAITFERCDRPAGWPGEEQENET